MYERPFYIRKSPSLKAIGTPMLIISLILFWTIIPRQSCSQPLDDLAGNIVCLSSKTGDSLRLVGTGFIMDKEGYLVTAYHCVKNVRTLCIQSCAWGKVHKDLATYLVRRYSDVNEDDVALLKVPESFVDVNKFHSFELVDPLATGLQTKQVCWLTACTDTLWKFANISNFVPPKRLWVNGFQLLRKCDSGSPVFLTETGAIVGMIRAPVSYIPYPDSAGDTLYFAAWDTELISALAIKDIEPHNPADFVIGTNQGEQRTTDSATARDVYQDVESLKSYMKTVMERKSLLFEDKDLIDLTIYAFLEAKSFIKSMEQKRQRGESFSEDRAQAIRFYIRGLETKATKRHGYNEAIEYFRLALEIDPSFAEPRYQIAFLNLRNPDSLSMVHRELALALKYDPENYEVVRAYGVYYLTVGEYDSTLVTLKEAKELYKRLFPEAETDPRLLLYWGAYYDPTWHENATENRKTDIDKARLNYIKSLDLQPYFITPANNFNWTLLRQLEMDDSGREPRLTKGQREDLKDKLRKGLAILQPYVDWGFRDPRALETFAHAHAYLTMIESDPILRKSDCMRTCEYVKLIKEGLEVVAIPQPDAVEIGKGLQYATEVCKKCK